MKSKIIISLLPVAALGFAVPAFADVASEAGARAQSNIAEVRGDAAKAAMQELDAEIDRVDAMIDNAPTQAEKDAAKARMDVLKERRNELRKTYVKARYDELKADVRAEANKFGNWTSSKFHRSPADKAADEVKDAADDAKDAAKDAAHDARKAARKAGDNTYAYASSAGAALDLAAYKARPTDVNKDEAKAAIKALDQKIDELDDRADKMPRGPERDAAKRRVKALEDRKDELKHEFNKARFNALVDDVQGEWNQIVH